MIRTFALAVSIVFLLLGILGFVPALRFGSEQHLLGVFAVDVVGNLIHLAVGILGIAAYYWDWSRAFCQGLGVVFLLLGILGFIPALMFTDDMLLGMMHVSLSDNLLHLIVGGAAAYLGFSPQFTSRPAPTP